MKHIFKNSWHLLWLFVLVTKPSESRKPSEEKDHRQGKLFPIFQIVRFQNDPCAAGALNGTCYTSDECTQRGGTASGSTCANGYGICCTFSNTCGQMTNENCTYFENPSTVSTETDCNLEICPCGNNICQIRLDFETFVITGPSTDSTTRGGTRFGNFVPIAGTTPRTDYAIVSNVGQCLTDLFSVTSPGNNAPPPVCGTLSDEHMYVDLNEGCDNLRFSFNPSGQGAPIVDRRWRIKVTQYSCEYNNLAPPGCTQYFFGNAAGQIMSYNFNNQHLADQDQNICIRREAAYCRICYVPTAATDFQLSGPTGAGVAMNRRDDSKVCCNYGTNGVSPNGFDCLEIPGVTGTTGMGGNNANALQSRFCGRGGFKKDTGVAIGAKATICTFTLPFSVRFRSDRYEFLNDDTTATESEGAGQDVGFRLAYVMDATGCPI